MIRKLRVRFVLVNMAVVVTALLVIFAFVYGKTSRDLESESLRMMRSLVTEPIRPGRPGQRQDEVRLPYFLIEIGRDGQLTPLGGWFDLTDLDYIRDIYSAAVSQGRPDGVLRQYGLRYCFGRSVRGESVVFVDMSSETAALRSLAGTFILIGLLSLAAFLVISVLLARWVSRPVERAWERQRQFVADASHELKTPLTVILTNAELLTSPAADDETREKYAGNILAMSRQMRALVQGLLDLARVENSSAAAFEPVDLSGLVNDAVLPFEPLYFERGLGLDASVEAGITVTGSPQQLRQTVDILLDNALKYSAPGTVRASLTRQGRKCLLTVASPGAEMSKQELEDIFKRFYRADKARRMDGSFGLGLSIAREIVASHRGTIKADSRDGVNTFTVELPLG